MYEHSELLNVILSHCKGLLYDEAVEANDGFQIYKVELPGLDVIVEARRTSMIGYTYIIRSYDRRFKVYTSTPRSEAMSSMIPSAPALPTLTQPSQSATFTKVRSPFQKPIPRSSVTMAATPRKTKKKT